MPGEALHTTLPILQRQQEVKSLDDGRPLSRLFRRFAAMRETNQLPLVEACCDLDLDRPHLFLSHSTGIDTGKIFRRSHFTRLVHRSGTLIRAPAFLKTRESPAV